MLAAITFPVVGYLWLLAILVAEVRQGRPTVLSTNARIGITFVSQLFASLGFFASPSDIELPDNRLFEMAMTWPFPHALMTFGIGSSFFTLMYRISIFRRFNYTPLDESLRYSAVIQSVSFCLLATLSSLVHNPDSRAVYLCSSILLLTSLLLCTLFNPIFLWRRPECVSKHVSRPRLFAVSYCAGLLIIILVAGFVLRYGGELALQSVTGVLTGLVTFTVFTSAQQTNNEICNIISAAVTEESTVSHRPSKIESKSNRIHLVSDNPNDISVTGVQAVGIFHGAMSISMLQISRSAIWSPDTICSFMSCEYDGVNKCQCYGEYTFSPGDAHGSPFLFVCSCVCVTRLVLQLLSLLEPPPSSSKFDEYSVHRDPGQKPFVSFFHTLIAFSSTWRGRQLISAANFALNFVVFLLNYSGQQNNFLIFTILILSGGGLVCNLLAIAATRFHFLALLPRDNAFRLSMFLKGTLLEMKTLIVVMMSEYQNWNPFTQTVLSLCIITLLVIAIINAVTVRRIWKDRRQLSSIVPNPSLFILSYACASVWTQLASIAILAASHINPVYLCGSGASYCFFSVLLFFTGAPAIFFTTISVNEMARVLDSVPTEETCSNLYSHSSSLTGVKAMQTLWVLLSIICFMAVYYSRTETPLSSFICAVYSIPFACVVMMEFAAADIWFSRKANKDSLKMGLLENNL